MAFAIGSALGAFTAAVRSNIGFAGMAANQRRANLAFGSSGMALNQVYAQDRELALSQAGLGIEHKAMSAEEQAIEKIQKDSIKGFSTFA